MTIIDFAKLYNFHDSSIIDIKSYTEKHTVLLTIELSWWQQKEYSKGEPEIIKKTFLFTEVDKFICPDEIPYEQVGIFSINSNENAIYIYMVNDFTDEDFTIIISAKNVYVQSV